LLALQKTLLKSGKWLLAAFQKKFVQSKQFSKVKGFDVKRVRLFIKHNFKETISLDYICLKIILMDDAYCKHTAMNIKFFLKLSLNFY
jgi:hypothetical protein